MKIKSKLLFCIVIFVFAVVALNGAAYAAGNKEILVVRGDYDSIESVLDRLGIDYDIISRDKLSDRNLTGVKQLYLNCGCDERNPGGGVIDRVKRFVEKDGGSLYVSDWASHYIGRWGVKFHGDSLSGDVKATINDVGLKNYLGTDKIDIRYDNEKWRVIVDRHDYPVLLSGNISKMYTEKDGDKESPTASPLAISFKALKGNVVYTTFHNEKNASGSADMMKAVEYFALKPIADTAVQKALSGIDIKDIERYNFNSSISFLKKVHSEDIVIPQGESKTYIFAVTDTVLSKDVMTKGTKAKSCEVELFGPDGVSRGTKNVGSNGIAIFDVPEDRPGNWKFVVKSYTDYDDYTLVTAASVKKLSKNPPEWDEGGCSTGFGYSCSLLGLALLVPFVRRKRGL